MFQDIWHAIIRGGLHIVCAPFVNQLVFLLIRYWGRHNRKVPIFISGRRSHLVYTSAVHTMLLMTLREPIDAAFGWQVWWKGSTDQLSWVIGVGLWVWFMFRFAPKEEPEWRL